MKNLIITLAFIAISVLCANAQTPTDSTTLYAQYAVSIDAATSYQLGTVNYSTFGRQVNKKTGAYSNIGISPMVGSFNFNFGAAIPYKGNPQAHKFIDIGIKFNSDYGFVRKKSELDNQYLYIGFEIGFRWQNYTKNGVFCRATLGEGYLDMGYNLKNTTNKYEYSGFALIPSFTVGYAFITNKHRVAMQKN